MIFITKIYIFVHSILSLQKKYFKIHTTLIVLCLAISYVISSFAPSIVKDNFIVKIFYNPPKSYENRLDQNGIPLTYYGMIYDGKPIGSQRNPVSVAQQANEFYDMYKKDNSESSKTYFLNNVNWLVNNAVKKENYSLLQYNFPIPYYNLKPVWYSAMANGLALQVLIKAPEISHDLKYLEAAKSLLNAFFIEVQHGGITYKDSEHEWWYEEYASNDKNANISRVLNGMIFAVLGIYDYYKFTNDPDAKLLFDNGVNSIKKELSKYNNNGYSYYDILGNIASWKYHQIHINLTKQLHDLTGEPIFNNYHELWKKHNNPSLPNIPLNIPQPSLKLFLTSTIILISFTEIILLITLKIFNLKFIQTRKLVNKKK